MSITFKVIDAVDNLLLVEYSAGDRKITLNIGYPENDTNIVEYISERVPRQLFHMPIRTQKIEDVRALSGSIKLKTKKILNNIHEDFIIQNKNKIKYFVKELDKKDKYLMLEVVQTRIDYKNTIALSKTPIDIEWIQNIIISDDYFTKYLRVFGLFIEDKNNKKNILDSFFILKIINDKCYSVQIIISRKSDYKRPIENGYCKFTTELQDFGIKQMENYGYFEFYSLIPCIKKWKRSDKNKNRNKLGYEITEVETVFAGEIPKIPFHLNFMNKPFNIDMVIRRFVKKEMIKNA